MTTRKIGTIALCPCGREFIVTAPGQRNCRPCHKAKDQAVSAAQTVTCRRCHAIKPCRQNICPHCQMARWRAWRADYTAREQAENVERLPEPVEIYVELCMEKYGPRFPMISARRLATIERAIRSLRTKLLKGPNAIHNEFTMLLCEIAYRRQGLSLVQWARMRRMKYGGGKWLRELRILFAVITATPLPESYVPARKDPICADDLEPMLPLLRRMSADPDWMPFCDDQSETQTMDTAAMDTQMATKGESIVDLVSMILYFRVTPERQANVRRLWANRGDTHLLTLAGYTLDEVLSEGKEVEKQRSGADDHTEDHNDMDDSIASFLQSLDF